MCPLTLFLCVGGYFVSYYFFNARYFYESTKNKLLTQTIMIPKQEYELISVSKLGVENGNALVCEDCGRVIFNFAIIKGKRDGKSYTVGLTCVKKLLKIKQVSFDFEDEWKMQMEEKLFDEAARVAKWVAKKLKKFEENGFEPYVEICDFRSYEGEDLFCVYILTDKDYHGIKGSGHRLARTTSLQPRFKAFFKSFVA